MAISMAKITPALSWFRSSSPAPDCWIAGVRGEDIGELAQQVRAAMRVCAAKSDSLAGDAMPLLHLFGQRLGHVRRQTDRVDCDHQMNLAVAMPQGHRPHQQRRIDCGVGVVAASVTRHPQRFDWRYIKFAEASEPAFVTYGGQRFADYQQGERKKQKAAELHVTVVKGPAELLGLAGRNRRQDYLGQRNRHHCDQPDHNRQGEEQRAIGTESRGGFGGEDRSTGRGNDRRQL